MSTVIDLSDPRTQRAIPIAANSGQWIRCTRRDGQHLFGIPSSKPGVHYFTTADYCSCPDQKFHPELECKHQLAVRIHEALA